MTDTNQQIAEGYQRQADFVFAACNDHSRDLMPDWRTSIYDLAHELDLIVSSPLTNPDAAARARSAMGMLAGLWLSGEQTEALYLGDRS